MVSVRNTKLIEEVFNDHHPGAEGDEFEKTYTLKSQCKTELNGHIWGEKLTYSWRISK